MNIENTKAQMRKGVLEFCILSVLKEKEAYTSEILDTLKAAKLLVVEGTDLPFANPIKKRRTTYLQMGRIYLWTTQKILRSYRTRQNIFNRTKWHLERTF